MEKAVQLSEKIINEVNDYSKAYTSTEGKIATTEQSLIVLNAIIQDICVLYKYVVDKKLYEKMQRIIPTLNTLAELIMKIQITEDNANKLHLDSANQLWQQIKAVGALLACMIVEQDEADKQGVK